MASMRNHSKIRSIIAVLGGGCLLQMASCTDVAAEMVSGLLTSVSTELITNLVNEYLGLSGGLFPFM
jgi:hypothetical protein